MISMTTISKSPLNIPANFTQPKKSYYFRASLALLAILLFFTLYISLIYFLGYLIYLAIIYPMFDVNKFTIILKIGAIAGSAMLFVFALKFIFKLKNHKPTNRIKLIKDENPKLWEFILDICKQTGAPKPKNIYLDPDVNAYFSYTNSWLSLFLPIKKELTIGIGITESLNLSEFKAVMTHEFGHFAQRSMKIGSYIMTANTIIHDMIFNRDRWDRALETWRSSDIQLSIAAWVITPIIWILRQTLILFYQFLNIMYSSLSREMEFNADKYAVSTTGSDPIVSGLWKLETAFHNWNNQLNLIYLASLKQLYPENIFAHYNKVVEKMNSQVKSNYENLPLNDLGGKKFFEHSANSSVSMYASHPPNNLREIYAKTPYIPCDIDESSPLQLFGNIEHLQKQLTKVIFKQYFQKEPEKYCSFEDFENFTTAETAHKHLHNEYENTFESRFLNIPDISELKNTNIEKENFQENLIVLQSKLKQLLIPIKELDEKIKEIIEVSNGSTKLKKNSI